MASKSKNADMLDQLMSQISPEDQERIKRGQAPTPSAQTTAAKFLWHAVHGYGACRADQNIVGKDQQVQ